jgi:hypothetical protein
MRRLVIPRASCRGRPWASGASGHRPYRGHCERAWRRNLANSHFDHGHFAGGRHRCWRRRIYIGRCRRARVTSDDDADEPPPVGPAEIPAASVVYLSQFGCSLLYVGSAPLIPFHFIASPSPSNRLPAHDATDSVAAADREPDGRGHLVRTRAHTDGARKLAGPAAPGRATRLAGPSRLAGRPAARLYLNESCLGREARPGECTDFFVFVGPGRCAFHLISSQLIFS